MKKKKKSCLLEKKIKLNLIKLKLTQAKIPWECWFICEVLFRIRVQNLGLVLNILLKKSGFRVMKLDTKNFRQKDHSLSSYCLNEREYKLSKMLFNFNNLQQFFSWIAILLKTSHTLMGLTTWNFTVFKKAKLNCDSSIFVGHGKNLISSRL